MSAQHRFDNDCFVQPTAIGTRGSPSSPPISANKPLTPCDAHSRCAIAAEQSHSPLSGIVEPPHFASTAFVSRKDPW